MKKQILAPIDFSDVTDAVITHGAEMARALGATLRLFHVVEVPPDFAGIFSEVGFIGPIPGPELFEDVVEKRKETLKEIELRLSREGIETSSVVIQGTPSVDILGEAERMRADLIIIGSHGHGALHHLLLGSVSEAVLRYAPCPVLVIHSQPDMSKRHPSSSSLK